MWPSPFLTLRFPSASPPPSSLASPQGDIEFQVTAVNKAEGEFSGVFVSKQPGDTDMGGKTPKSLLIKGQFFARAE